MSIYGIYDMKDNEMCLRVGTLGEIIKFIDLTTQEMSWAIKKQSLIRKRYKIYYLFKEV